MEPSHSADNHQYEEEKPQLPMGDRDYIACRKCHSILTAPQYARDGCIKCGDSGENPSELTTTRFSGFVGLVAPEYSWVARMIGCKYMPSGVYASALEDEDEEDEEDEDMDEGGHAGDPEDAYDDEDDVVAKKDAEMDVYLGLA